MSNFLIHLFSGLIISYILAFPLGPVNLAVFQTAVERGKREAYLISVGSALAELFYCLLAVGALAFLFPDGERESKAILTLEILAVPVLTFLGVQCLVVKPEEKEKSYLNRSSLLLGLTLNLTNVQILALWTGVSAYLRSHRILVNHLNTHSDYFLTMTFVAAVGLGTFLTHATFIYLSGLKSFQLTASRKRRLNVTIGILFLVFAGYQSYLLIDRYWG